MAIPKTSIRASHAVTIRTSDGTTIGLIQSWAPNQARPTTAVYQLNASDGKVPPGEIYERVPMNITGTTINVNRVDLYNLRMENAWGKNFSAIKMLTDQNNPLEIRELWSNPNDGSKTTLVYQGCWFTSLGRNLPADGDKVVRVNAAIDYVRVYEI
jgi:hypothetical protein